MNKIEFENYNTKIKIHPSFIQRFSNGDYLLVESRQSKLYPNAFVFDGNGKLLNSFKLGDAIEKIIIDGLNRIWVGYFDEGIFQSEAISRHGLNRFDKNGKLEYSFAQGEHFYIDDILNLNIDDNNNIVFSPYSQEKVATITNNKTNIIYHNPIGFYPHGVYANNDYILKIGAGFDKNDPMGKLEDQDYISHDINNKKTTFGPMHGKLDENRFEIYESCIIIINRKSQLIKLVQVFDENAKILSLRNCNTYKNRALISANNKIYELDLDKLL